ncbi:hypothetical protein Droror1_Dr00017259 [Drosera rotundifolia]
MFCLIELSFCSFVHIVSFNENYMVLLLGQSACYTRCFLLFLPSRLVCSCQLCLLQYASLSYGANIQESYIPCLVARGISEESSCSSLYILVSWITFVPAWISFSVSPASSDAKVMVFFPFYQSDPIQSHISVTLATHLIGKNTSESN